MDSETYYRKYRPQTLKDLDKEVIREGLTKIVRSKKIPHAFLFSGPKGIGKTSAARVLAKAVNCQKKKGHEPCNRCEICQAITQGTALDLLEIDAASNRGIDDVRDLREKIRLAPVKAPFKVYIIDEVHMLTQEAFNALLKTLEEPPPHALFILCTTQPEKLPETIISRCLRFNFQKAEEKEIMRSLAKIVKGEKLKVASGVLEAIAKQADGSFRDAQKVLDQLAAGSKKITLAETEKLLGQIEAWQPDKLLALLAQKAVKAALTEVARIATAGADLGQFTQNLLAVLRQSLLGQLGLTGIKVPPSVADFDLGQIRFLINLFTRAHQELKFSPIPSLPLELAVVEYCLEARDKTEASLPPVKVVARENKSQSAPVSLALKKIISKWPEVLAKVKPLNHSVEALLRACRPKTVKDDQLTLEVFYKFHKERLETEKCRQVVEEALGEVLGSPVRVYCVLGQKEKDKVVDQPDIISVAEEIFSGRLIH